MIFQTLVFEQKKGKRYFSDISCKAASPPNLFQEWFLEKTTPNALASFLAKVEQPKKKHGTSDQWLRTPWSSARTRQTPHAILRLGSPPLLGSSPLPSRGNRGGFYSCWLLMVAEYRLPMTWSSDLNIFFISRFSFRQPRRPRHDLDDSVSERAKGVKLEPGTSFEERWMEFFWKRSTKVKGVNKLIISNGVCWKNKGRGGGQQICSKLASYTVDIAGIAQSKQEIALNYSINMTPTLLWLVNMLGGLMGLGEVVTQKYLNRCVLMLNL